VVAAPFQISRIRRLFLNLPFSQENDDQAIVRFANYCCPG
jgi:hypothetical protein